MNRSRALTLTVASLLVAASLALAACGDDDDDGGDGGDAASATTDTGAAAATGGGAIAVETIDGREVLADAQGRALYTAEEEAGGQVLCTAECLTIWEPVAPSGGEPGAPELGLEVITRPDGGMQVTYDGAPLYRFLEEGAGELSGDGVVDTFAGTEFTWTVASTDEGGSEAAEPEDSEPEDSGGGIGY